NTVVERQPLRDPPVVLRKGFVVDSQECTLGPSGRLRIGTEHADGGVREPERGVECIVYVVAEVDRTGYVARTAPLQAAEVVIAGLEGVLAVHLRHAGVPCAVARVEDEIGSAGDARVRTPGPHIRMGRVGDASAPGELRRRKNSCSV